jgi:hypothetical protein
MSIKWRRKKIIVELLDRSKMHYYVLMTNVHHGIEKIAIKKAQDIHTIN